MPGRRAGTKQRQPQTRRGHHPRQALRQGIEAGVVAKIRAELACQIALRKGVQHRFHRTLPLVFEDHLAETRRHHHRRIGTQRSVDAFRPQRGLGDVIAHAEPVRLPQRRLHFAALRGRQKIPLHPADGIEDQRAALRQRIASGHVGHASRSAELACRPRGRRNRIVVMARDGCSGRSRLEQHDRSLPGAAGQQFAAGVNQVGGRRIAPRGKRLHPVPAERPQIACRQSRESERLLRQQGRQQMRKQQVAEVVAIEGAKQDRWGSGRRFHFLRDSVDAIGFIHAYPCIRTLHDFELHSTRIVHY